MKHQFILEAECDGRYVAPERQQELQDFVAGRAWTIDGIVHPTACAKRIGHDVVVVTRTEYDQLIALKRHVETAGAPNKAKD